MSKLPRKKLTDRSFALLLIPIGAMWAMEIVDWFLDQRLNDYGIIPRDRRGLIGIPLSPFLHAGFGHLISNTIPLVILGGLVLLSSAKQFLQVSVTIILLGGLGVWLFAIGGNHIGASGLVFGYFGFIVVRGYFERTIPSLIVAAVVIFMYGGGMLIGMLPVTKGVSWEGHLFGFLAGAFAARSMAVENFRSKQL
jgi:membrane associated rhomboid family serine protease